MLGKHSGVITLIIPIHRVIYREHLTAKYFKYDHVMKTVMEIVNFIRSSAKTHRQLGNFVEDLD